MKKAIFIEYFGYASGVLATVILLLDLFNIWTFPFAWVVYWGLYFACIALVPLGIKMQNNIVSLYQLLVMTAFADKELSSDEEKKIEKYAKQFGISAKLQASMHILLANGKSCTEVPENEKTRKKHIKKIIEIANADGNIDDEELAFIKAVAKKYGLSENFVDTLVKE